MYQSMLLRKYLLQFILLISSKYKLIQNISIFNVTLNIIYHNFVTYYRESNKFVKKNNILIFTNNQLVIPIHDIMQKNYKVITKKA